MQVVDLDLKPDKDTDGRATAYRDRLLGLFDAAGFPSAYSNSGNGAHVFAAISPEYVGAPIVGLKDKYGLIRPLPDLPDPEALGVDVFNAGCRFLVAVNLDRLRPGFTLDSRLPVVPPQYAGELIAAARTEAGTKAMLQKLTPPEPATPDPAPVVPEATERSIPAPVASRP